MNNDLRERSFAEHFQKCLVALTLAAFVCSVFSAISSWLLLLLLPNSGIQEEQGFFVRLFVKAVLFTLLAAGSGFGLTRWGPRRAVSRETPQAPPRETAYSRMLFLLAIGLAAALVLPNLATYPWTGPDELHHLIVSKNLAENGAYASGHPSTGLRRFDDYDSVGSPVIAPIALAFRLTGTNFVAGRMVIATSYLVLCLLIYYLVKPARGSAAGASAVIVTTMSFGSVYFARTVYGEVPAMMFFMAGLFFWRASLDSNRATFPAVMAGILIGLAVLTKSFILVSACAFLGVFFYDRLNARTIGWKQVVWPALGVAGVLASWMGVEALFGDAGGERPSSFVFYRHYLMFGLDSFPRGLGWMAAQPVSLALALVGLAWVTPWLFAKKLDPALLVLYLTGILYAFWWIFFTPANIPRYMWYTSAVAGIFAGTMLDDFRRMLSHKQVPRLAKAVAAAGILLLLGTGFARLAPEFERVYWHDQMVGELEMVDYVKSLPQDASIATTYWVAVRSVTFFTNHQLDIVYDPSEAREQYDVLIMDDYTETIPPAIRASASRLGRYVIVSEKFDPYGGRHGDE